nr:unnamed protein product [Callosobruchus chinensis]
MSSSFTRHTLTHPKTANRYKIDKCDECYARFKSKEALDDHIIRRHPDLIASVSSEIHNCPYCTYKTVSKHNLATHMSKHPETAHASKVRTCIQCSASYKYKIDLDDHIVRKHPSFIQYVSSKIYECTRCDHKTTMRRSFVKHLSRH